MTLELIITIFSFVGLLLGGYVKIQLDIQKNHDKIDHTREILEMQIINLIKASSEREDRFIESMNKLEKTIDELRKSVNEIQKTK